MHRPQYFEAHGTGTPAGDPIEANAISTSFFPNNEKTDERLYVGSIKTIIGHTEGAAGLAGILKVCLMLRKGIIPPNLLFDHLSPSIEPFYANLHVPTAAIAWPALPSDGLRRASVNRYLTIQLKQHFARCSSNRSISFGFGGTNAHAILESYEGKGHLRPERANNPIFIPFVFSAASRYSLLTYLERFLQYLRSHGDLLNLADIAYTLYARRTHHTMSISFAALSLEELSDKLSDALKECQRDPSYSLATEMRCKASTTGRGRSILGIFTGQGAQWAQMGVDLIKFSPAARNIIQKLQERLYRLPEEDVPSWSIIEELGKDASVSRMGEAVISQTLCTAVQILQIELLRAAGIRFTSVVGHSSGEIACAFAAGFISPEDAICIAYYRGLHSRYATQGFMLAVGTSAEDAEHLLGFEEFKGRACIAAINSQASVTISGDSDAIHELKIVFKDEKKFTRILKVDKAYHSKHMAPCSDHYVRSLANLDIQVRGGRLATWYSSVSGGDMGREDGMLSCQYWDDNMVRPVNFMQAIRNAHAANGDFDLVVEIGPHSALKGPSLQVLSNGKEQLPYTGLFYRGS